VLARLGLQVVLKSFYSPIPDLASIPDSTWERESDLAGIHFDLDEQLVFLERHRRELAEFAPPSGYYLDNGAYGPVDADVLYAIVRAAKSTRIVELGSGYTTLLIAEANRRNELDGAGADFRAYDPYPGVVKGSLSGLTELARTPAEELPAEAFSALGENDLLVVDTTHTVKTGGDVNHVVLDVLPLLRPGVLVHFHDIFLPWEYPRKWAEDYGLYWAEQYLLQAFLSLNREYEIVCALHAISRRHPDRLRDLVRTWRDGIVPGAFWLRRR
jgi:methyltransferase family protein